MDRLEKLKKALEYLQESEDEDIYMVTIEHVSSHIEDFIQLRTESIQQMYLTDPEESFETYGDFLASVRMNVKKSMKQLEEVRDILSKTMQGERFTKCPNCLEEEQIARPTGMMCSNCKLYYQKVEVK